MLTGKQHTLLRLRSMWLDYIGEQESAIDACNENIATAQSRIRQIDLEINLPTELPAVAELA